MNLISFPLHAACDAFSVINGCIAPGGVPIPLLAAQAGATPFYVYDRQALSRRVTRLRAQLPPELLLHYAIKANPMPAVVQHLASLVDGFDVASAGEMRVALDTTMKPACVSFAGPGKSGQEIRQAVAAGIVITVESMSQLEIVRSAGELLGVTPDVAVRVNPAFELKSSGMRMGGGAKPFGIDEERVPSVLQRLREFGLQLTGIHVFAGSQNLNAAAIVEAQQHTWNLVQRLLGEWGNPVAWINIGGGFGIPYFPGEKELDLEPIGANLAELCLKAHTGFGVPLAIELGRYLVGPVGLYVCRVIERKESCGKVFLVTDGGLHHQLAASGNFGQVLRKNYPLAVANRLDAKETGHQTVVGPLCTPLDLLGDNVQLPHAEAGDFIAVFQSGAYGYTASPLLFLGHPHPGEMLV